MFNDYLSSLFLILADNYKLQIALQALLIFALSFALSFFGINWFIKMVSKKSICRQPIRSDGPESHLKTKKNTPTMGGLFIIASTLISSLLIADIKNIYVQVVLFVMVSFSFIGFIDDYIKITGKNSKGFRGSIKLVIQFLIVTLLVFWLRLNDEAHFNGSVLLPFTDFALNLGLFYIFFATFVIVGSANAVNLTDGLDGLVTVPAIISLICFILMICVIGSGFGLFDDDLLITTQSQNILPLIMFCVSLIGSLLAFLKFNLKPAKIFMGDVGSLGIGAALGSLAIILKKELIFAIIALLFVIEALSVILQVSCYKISKKRPLLMAPLHHHFEKKGWSEKKVVKSFWLASLFFACLGMLIFLVSL